MSATTMNRAARRAARSTRRRGIDFDQLRAWADAAEAKARTEGRARGLPSAAANPDDMSDAEFHGVMNVIGRREPLERFLHCLESARDELRRGDLYGAENALRMGCTMMPRDEEDAVAFDAATGHDGLDALEYGLFAVEDGDAGKALAIISRWLDGRAAA